MWVAIALEVLNVVLNRMRCSRADDVSAFALHKKRRITGNRKLDLARLPPEL